MKNQTMKIAIKAVSCAVVGIFLTNTIAYGLGPMPASNCPATQKAMNALGDKRFGIDKGPGSINFTPTSFVEGGELQRAREKAVNTGYDAEFVSADYDNPPEAWENNPILKETDLIEALETFRDREAKIPSENLEIRAGYFPVDEEEGKLPISQIEKTGEDKYILIVHTKFVQMWNHIRENDTWFEVDLEDGNKRTVSVAWGIFYRLAKHEMRDLQKNSATSKGGGHVTFYDDKVVARDDETMANMIGGRYHDANDAIWLWFLGAYCFRNKTQYNNETLYQRIKWIFEDREAEELQLNDEFPFLSSVLSKDRRLAVAILACDINRNFFGSGRERIAVPETKVDERFIEEYEDRERMRNQSISQHKHKVDILPSGSKSEEGALIRRQPEEDILIDEAAVMVIEEIAESSDINPEKKVELIKEWRKFIAREGARLNNLSGMTTFERIKEGFRRDIKHDKRQSVMGIILELMGVAGASVLIRQAYLFGMNIDFVVAQVMIIGMILLSNSLIVSKGKGVTSAIKKALAKTEAKQENSSAAAESSAETVSHPLVKLIAETIVTPGYNRGPGVDELTLAETESVYITAMLLKQERIELFIPQALQLTEKMQTAIKDIKSKIGNNVTYRIYSDFKCLTTMLESTPNGKRMIITANVAEKEELALVQYVNDTPRAFQGARFLNMELPADYPEMRERTKVICQAKIVTIAILARLLDGNKTPKVEMFLRYMLEGRINLDEKEMDRFLKRLGDPKEDASSKGNKLISRILYLLKHPIRLVEEIEREHRLMKVFWRSA